MTYEPFVLGGLLLMLLGHCYMLVVRDQVMDRRRYHQAMLVGSWFGTLAFFYFVIGMVSWILR